MLPDFFCSLFPVQQTTSGIGHQYAENVRNNNFSPITGGCSEGLGAL